MGVLRTEKQRLLADARAGDVEAFAQLFEACRPMIHRIACRLVGPDDGDDVVMETYLKAWRGLARFRGGSAVSTWLCRIARNCALDHWRRRARREGRTLSADDPQAPAAVSAVPDRRDRGPGQQVEARDLEAAIDRALAQLSSAQRTAFLLHEVDGLKYREVAAATGVSTGTVMSRLFHARRRLRRLLEDWQP